MPPNENLPDRAPRTPVNPCLTCHPRSQNICTSQASRFPDPSPFVKTYHSLVDVMSQTGGLDSRPTFQLNEPVRVVCGLSNEGTDDLKVQAIFGSINSVYDFNMMLQNMTQPYHDLTVKPNSEVSLSFEFKILETRALSGRLHLVAFYTDGVSQFASTFMNETVELVEPPLSFGVADVFMYLTVFAVLGLSGGFFLMRIGSGLMSGGRSRQAMETGTKDGPSAAEREWIESALNKGTGAGGKKRR